MVHMIQISQSNLDDWRQATSECQVLAALLEKDHYWIVEKFK